MHDIHMQKLEEQKQPKKEQEKTIPQKKAEPVLVKAGEKAKQPVVTKKEFDGWSGLF